jgi:hypothetical protein
VATAYFSTVFDQPADTVWSVIRDFNNYAVWVNGVGESRIEDGKTGEAVGAVRNVLYQDKRIRQRLLAMSDAERSQTYEFCGPAPMPVHSYRATLRVTPVVDGDRAFVEWWATFDCATDERDKWTTFYRNAFATWLESLRASLQREKTAA